MEMNREIGEAISLLFERQFNIQSDGFAFALGRPAIGRFHNAGATTGNNGKMVLGKLPANGHGRLVVRISWRSASGAEDCHGWPHLRERFKRVNKFGHDPKDSPGILTDEANRIAIHPPSIVGALTGDKMGGPVERVELRSG